MFPCTFPISLSTYGRINMDPKCRTVRAEVDIDNYQYVSAGLRGRSGLCAGRPSHHQEVALRAEVIPPLRATVLYS